MIAVNLTGVFNFCRAVVPHMRSRSYGRIVNIASIAGKEGKPAHDSVLSDQGRRHRLNPDRFEKSWPPTAFA